MSPTANPEKPWVEPLDIAILASMGIATAAYFTKGRLWGKQADQRYGYSSRLVNDALNKPKKTRNIIEKMQETNKDLVVFYGSQTGTAEDYAQRLAKEGHSRFGLKSMTADPEDYDLDTLDTFPNNKLAMFILATYGEGEPTDNAVGFTELICGQDTTFSNGGGIDEKPLSNLKYVAFGLGNKTYEHYNAMVRKVDSALAQLGAQRLGDAGEGDDGDGTMEEDFLSWKEGMWDAVAAAMNLEEKETEYEPTLTVIEDESLSADSDQVYLGEPSKQHLTMSTGPYNAHNPYIAPILSSRELSKSKNRNCLHMEINLGLSGLAYRTGDHLALWPTNSDKEVDRLLRVLDLTEKHDKVIRVTSADPTAKIPIPQPTTYESVLRYYLEICAPVSRQFMSSLCQFSPSPETKAEVFKLATDKEYFKSKVSEKSMTLGQVMESIAPKWQVPFSLMVESLNHLQARYYSISSSSLTSPKVAHITAAVDSRTINGSDNVLNGVTTNYLYALKLRQHGAEDPRPYGLSYQLDGPRNKYDGIHVLVHTRHSNFKLPNDPAKPIIMVGPGTGVAPFRGFLQEKIEQVKQGTEIGQIILFFGCRRENEDFLYRDEWKVAEQELNGKFKIITAFSRETEQKIYVQHRLQEHSKQVNDLLQEGGYFYVCGDAAHMAREVNTLLGTIFEEQRNLPAKAGEELVKQMRNRGTYQEDVWS
ncbi:NADPH--cytochrome P450 reductase [Neolecta irregularis DAH-3]|uniref:NADPH--cytochrome P450 reductase n=1 Tax=Neolecta irregularis (strain DAH-3) TaxID=1198029 RepID=A0A1U7LKK2_NEOID|nr:NADPH--cytochrome P450 reductase [Neolecta irregularis DAH-3]|eukprot:OLL23051.1 NADPH--cytochrome P450 reductase [Neolecta irregularis DAH-3]